MIVVTHSQMEALLAEMEAELQAMIDRILVPANVKRMREGKCILSRTRAETVLRAIQGGDPVETLMRVEIGADGSMSV